MTELRCPHLLALTAGTTGIGAHDATVCPHCIANRRLDADRARELDDRPPVTLESIARDMAAERLPTLDELRAERFGRPRRDAA